MKKASHRAKRDLERHMEFIDNIIRNSESKEKRKRDNHDYTEIDRAYSKYYEKIQARYRDYVKTLFPNQRQRIASNNAPLNPPNANDEDVKNSNKMQVQDGRWYNNNDFKYRVQQKARSFNNDLQNQEEDEIKQPVALPTINDRVRHNNRYDPLVNATISNYYPSFVNEKVIEETSEKSKKPSNMDEIAAKIYAKLQSQIVRRRRKRENDDDGKDDEVAITGVGKKKDRTRGPCESLTDSPHMQIEIVKPPKNQNDSFGHGMVLKITCDTGYNNNVQTANSTVRCNKGVWKPVKPECSLSKKNMTKNYFYCFPVNFRTLFCAVN